MIGQSNADPPLAALYAREHARRQARCAERRRRVWVAAGLVLAWAGTVLAVSYALALWVR